MKRLIQELRYAFSVMADINNRYTLLYALPIFNWVKSTEVELRHTELEYYSEYGVKYLSTLR